jgi:multicomponent Na+:H+ antiporter subunit D
MNILLLLPILIPLLTAVLALFVHRQRRAQRILGVVGSSALLLAAIALFSQVWQHGILAGQFGNWPAPYGITFVADLLSAIMVLVVGMVGFTIAVYSLAVMDRRRELFGYYSLLHILLMGVCGAFLTGDVFNLYVWFEVMLIASFVLLALGGEQPQLEGAIKYVTLNLISSAFFLAAVGILYGEAGTLNMADLARRLPAMPDQGLVTAIAMLFLVAFGIKAGAFPLFFWLPASYHTPPVAVSALFAGLLTKVGIYSLIRVFTLIFVQDVGYTHNLILIIAVFTMVTGVLGAVAQNDFRRILAFHSVSQIGYMLMGLGFYTILGLAGTIFFVVHHSVVKMNLFLVSGVSNRIRGTYDLKYSGGLYTAVPGVAALFLISAFSLAGLPPFSGFFAKLILIQAGLDITQYVAIAVSLVVSVLTLFSMTKIWTEAFWKSVPQKGTASEHVQGVPVVRPREWQLMLFPIIGLAALTIVLGIAAGPVLDVFSEAAHQLLDPARYVEAVLGGRS